MKVTENGGADREEELRQGTSSYPLFPLEKSLRLAERVKELGGDCTEIGRGTLAAKLQVQEDSPGFAQQLASARCYGLLSGRGEYRLTEAAQDYFGAETEDERNKKGLVFLGVPPAFKEILDRFDGKKLPPTAALTNVLLKAKIAPKSWAPRIAQFFHRAAKQFGVLDQVGILRWNVSRNAPLTDGRMDDAIGSPPTTTVQLEAAVARATAHAPPIKVESPDMNLWVYGEGACAIRLETPRNLTEDLWGRLNSYVQILRPAPPKGEEGGS